MEEEDKAKSTEGRGERRQEEGGERGEEGVATG